MANTQMRRFLHLDNIEIMLRDVTDPGISVESFLSCTATEPRAKQEAHSKTANLKTHPSFTRLPSRHQLARGYGWS